jgi:hypothetical protein
MRRSSDLVLGQQLVVIDPHHDGQVGAIGRRRHENPFRPGLDILRRLGSLGELPGAFERHIDAEAAPGKLHRIAFGADRDLAAADIDPIVPAGDLTGEMPVNAVVSEEMRIGCDGAEIVDPDDLDVLTAVSCTARRTSRPMRPKPLMATRTVMSPSISNPCRDCSARQPACL